MCHFAISSPTSNNFSHTLQPLAAKAQPWVSGGIVCHLTRRWKKYSFSCGGGPDPLALCMEEWGRWKSPLEGTGPAFPAGKTSRSGAQQLEPAGSAPAVSELTHWDAVLWERKGKMLLNYWHPIIQYSQGRRSSAGLWGVFREMKLNNPTHCIISRAITKLSPQQYEFHICLFSHFHRAPPRTFMETVWSSQELCFEVRAVTDSELPLMHAFSALVLNILRLHSD